jgi:hypothetical protein
MPHTFCTMLLKGAVEVPSVHLLERRTAELPLP